MATKNSRLLLIALAAAAGMALAGNQSEAVQESRPAKSASQPKEDVQFKRLPNGDIALRNITVHRATGELSFPATFVLKSGVLEVLVATPEGRLHESLLKADVKPLNLQTALYLLDQENGSRFPDKEEQQGSILDIDVEWQDKDGKRVRQPVEAWVQDQRNGKQMKRFGWVFVGSMVVEGVLQAELGGNLAVVYSPADTVLELPDRSGDDDLIYVVREDTAQPVGNAVRVIVTPRKRTTASK